MGLKFGGPVLAIEEFLRNADPTNQGESGWIARNRALTTQRNLLRAQQIFNPNVTAVSRTAVGMEGGHAEIWMTIQIRHPDGKMEKRRVHVPVSIFQNGKFPSSGGKPGNRRSG